MPALRVIIILPRISARRNPVLDALARSDGVDLQVIYLSRRRRRLAAIELDDMDHPFSILSHGSVRLLLLRRLFRERFDVLVVPRGRHPAYAQAILLGRILGKTVILWIDGPPCPPGLLEKVCHGKLEPAGLSSRRIMEITGSLARKRE